MHPYGNLHPVIPTNLHSVIPTKVGIQFFEFQSFPINCLSIECLDSRLRGNDGILSWGHLLEKAETAPPSFPRKWESSFLSFSHFR
ncbi:hypothetical protein COI28_12825 [Neisseria meningitidis]|nr:hypothetical protein A6J49_13270 [Neisseria meningitidis]RNK00443.1 hypothetical protein COI28_12825 [Neisseria meningitidis]